MKLIFLCDQCFQQIAQIEEPYDHARIDKDDILRTTFKLKWKPKLVEKINILVTGL